ncbi:DUF262 domain-containing protein [Streptococcus agalactiae]|nr:DUF262 domain-containing protein [Streptococcus agalactiae]
MDVRFTQKTIGDLLREGNLHIPSYQRPYKWGRKQIRHLFYDLKNSLEQDATSKYQIGSLILHWQEEDKCAIVDGQQRLISLSLFLYALGHFEEYAGASRLLSQEFSNISLEHAQENHQEWQNLIELVGKVKAEEVCNFMLANCYLSVIELPSDKLAEAFQLFDSQNNRGKSLEPHDLLKAYHLRSIPNKEQNEETIIDWERIVTHKQLNLKDLFDKHLFRIRRWANGETGLTKKRYGSYLRFTEDFIDDFKGVNLTEENYPYLKIYKDLSDNNIAFPISLTMPMINGRAFFDYIKESHDSLVRLDEILKELETEEVAKIINRKESKFQRTRNLFDNAVALFVDRFGQEALTQEIVEVLLIWAYYPRIKASRILDSTLANYAAGGRFQNNDAQKLLQVMNQSLSPNDFLMRVDRDKFDNWNLKDLLEEIEK